MREIKIIMYFNFFVRGVDYSITAIAPTPLPLPSLISCVEAITGQSIPISHSESFSHLICGLI